MIAAARSKSNGDACLIFASSLYSLRAHGGVLTVTALGESGARNGDGEAENGWGPSRRRGGLEMIGGESVPRAFPSPRKRVLARFQIRHNAVRFSHMLWHIDFTTVF